MSIAGNQGDFVREWLEGHGHSFPHVPNTSTALNGATGMQLFSLLNGKAEAWCFLVIFVNYDLRLRGAVSAGGTVAELFSPFSRDRMVSVVSSFSFWEKKRLL